MLTPSYLSREDCRIAYYSLQEKGKPVLLLHGTGANSDLWAHQISILKENGHSPIFIDWRGHGRSGNCPIHGWEDFIRDILGVLERLKIEKTSIIGHSIGAMAALKFAEACPKRVEKVLAVGLTPKMNLLARSLIDKEVRFLHRHHPLVEKIPHLFLTERNIVGLKTHPQALIQCVELIKGWDIYQKPLNLKVPVYGCAGQFDLLMPPADGFKFKELCSAIKEFTVIPLAGHSAMDDQPERFNRWIMEALED